MYTFGFLYLGGKALSRARNGSGKEIIRFIARGESKVRSGEIPILVQEVLDTTRNHCHLPILDL